MGSYVKAMSSMTVLPTHVAPPSMRVETKVEVCNAASWVLAQSGLPNPVTYPSISNLDAKNKK